MIVLIPAYEPGGRLLQLVESLRRVGVHDVLVVDDGSGSRYDAWFAMVRDAGARVVRLPRNRGKGAALKVGFSLLAAQGRDEVVVCADSDGQHAVDDIIAVGREAERWGTTVLGVRAFAGSVPLRSRLGNALTRRAFRLAGGADVSDTQTGLRAYPAALLDWLSQVPGERYEYETRLLLEAARARLPWREVAIATIYHDGNSGSHFRPVVDSLRVYAPLVLFGVVSLVSFVLDAAALLALFALTGDLLASVVMARMVSASVNFMLNRRVVFTDTAMSLRASALRYWALVPTLLLANYLLLSLLLAAGLALLGAKVITEATLFLTSYAVQRALVFARVHRGVSRSRSAASTPDLAAAAYTPPGML